LSTMPKETLTLKRIFHFWIPLAATWFMMAVEGPFLAAVIARLTDPKFNLAAYGVAFSFAVLMESPIIMIMSASNALVKDRDSFLKLRNFTYVLNGVITVVMIIFLLPSVFNFITIQLIGLPENVSRLTHYACIVLLPWPAAIGYRRFYQGILVSSHLPKRVAYGTVVRLSSMAITALICYWFFNLTGAVVGTMALSLGVMAEAAASKFMAKKSVNRLLLKKSKEKSLSYRFISTFYFPLALTSILSLSVQPMVTFFIGHSRMALESLAVLPVINSLVFIFRCTGFSFQEVAIALFGENNEFYKPLRNFAVLLGLIVTAGLSFVAFTPLSFLWFHKVSGLSLELTRFANLPTKIVSIMPGLVVLLSFQRALLVNNRKTKPITVATVIEVVTIITILPFTIDFFGIVGAVAAAMALIIGRFLANSYLVIPVLQVLKKGRQR